MDRKFCFRFCTATLLLPTVFLMAQAAHLPASGLVLEKARGGKAAPLMPDAKKGKLFMFIMHDCPAANSYAPKIERLYQDYKNKIDFSLVYEEPDITRAMAQKHLKAYRYTCPALLDPGHMLAKRLGAKISPEAVLLNAKGAILYRGRIDNLYAGLGQQRYRATTNDLKDALNDFLEGRPIPHREEPAVGCLINGL